MMTGLLLCLATSDPAYDHNSMNQGDTTVLSYISSRLDECSF